MIDLGLNYREPDFKWYSGEIGGPRSEVVGKVWFDEMVVYFNRYKEAFKLVEDHNTIHKLIYSDSYYDRQYLPIVAQDAYKCWKNAKLE